MVNQMVKVYKRFSFPYQFKRTF